MLVFFNVMLMFITALLVLFTALLVPINALLQVVFISVWYRLQSHTNRKSVFPDSHANICKKHNGKLKLCSANS